MSEVFNYCHVAEQTDKGCRRPANEDWLAHFESPNGLVAVVCDGMGGHVGGQVASHVAVDAIKQFMMQEHAGSPGELIVEAINAANAAILNHAAQQPELTGMGSTCVMLVVRNGKVYIGSVGDSRIYLIRNHCIRQLTVDQSYVQMLVDAGSITKEQAEHHPRKNEITNALGLRGMKPATVLPEPLNPEAGDCFLLCSDGLSGMVSDHDICKVVSRQSDMSQQARVAELVERAKRNGGLDNITCQIVEFSVTPGTTNARGQSAGMISRKKTLLTACIALLVVCVAGGLVWLFIDHNGNTPMHSEQVTEMIEKADTTITLDSVKYEKGKVFLELREMNGLGIRLNQLNGSEPKTFQNYTLANKNVAPAGVASANESVMEDGSKDKIVKLVFDKELEEVENEIAITLYRATDNKKSMVLLVPVIKPQPEAETNAAEKGSEQKTDANANGKNIAGEIAAAASQLNGGEDGGSSAEKPEGETPVECSFAVDAENQIFKLHSSKGTNTKTDAYFPEFSFSTEITAEQDRGWYKIKNDGSICTLTIKNSKTHPVPANNSEAVITVQTNQGKAITVRIKKQ